MFWSSCGLMGFCSWQCCPPPLTCCFYIHYHKINAHNVTAQQICLCLQVGKTDTDYETFFDLQISYLHFHLSFTFTASEIRTVGGENQSEGKRKRCREKMNFHCKSVASVILVQFNIDQFSMNATFLVSEN